MKLKADAGLAVFALDDTLYVNRIQPAAQLVSFGIREPRATCLHLLRDEVYTGSDNGAIAQWDLQTGIMRCIVQPGGAAGVT